MLRLTDPIRPAEGSASGSADWPLPAATRDVLARVAPTNLPVLCTDCYGVAFRRVADAVHQRSGRDELVLVDLRRSAGTLPAGLPNGARAARTTLCFDGVEHLGPDGQEVFAREIASARYRLLSATDVPLDELRARWRPDLFALVSTVTVRAPALARRGDEIGALARQRLEQLCAELGRAVPQLSAAAETALIAHAWGGDTVELDAVLVRTLLAVEGALLDAGELRWQPDPAAAGAALAPTAASRTATPTRTDGGPREPTTSERCARKGGAVEAAPVEVVAPERPATAARDEVEAEPPPPRRELAAGPSPTLEALAVELAHQLKNPLVTVKTFVASVDALCEDPHELSQFRVLTEEAVTRMDEILDGLLAFTRLGTARATSFDALTLVREALRAAWHGFASKQVTLDAPEGATLWTVSDVEHVRFALAALARHVAETIEARGTLRIDVDDGGSLLFSYRESGAITHLRGVANASPSSLPLALLLVRGALGRVGGDLEVTLEDTSVLIRFRLGPP